ncbi:hypothetical protein DNTS_030943 [Danionella cerebrum]|uniref:trypsin n=1 Tax=Danionella cerebrum TaxID=2873325 RepID=A0A553Q5I4_9TELE|nr:hypothetical protein DNTS_030943 [Danionella translucida]TRY85184.1 hypothetical protein DNTS_030943 [Danionella translucida]
MFPSAEAPRGLVFLLFGIFLLCLQPDATSVTQKVLTTDGKDCKFPFLFRGLIHHRCISMNSSQSWCSLTHNFDHDQQWGFCSSQTHLHNGNCFETLHLRFYEPGESWGRIDQRTVELCKCESSQIKCERARYTVCSVNPCENEGVCRMIEETAEHVCGCLSGFTGKYCNLAVNHRSPVHSSSSSLRPSRSSSSSSVKGCGRRLIKPPGATRILGGSPALPGSHPWMAALYISDEFCAGTVLSSCWIASAAHCFLRNQLKSEIRVVLGQHQFNISGLNTRTFRVQKYILHPNYTLVKLKKENGRCAQWNSFIRPICLPETSATFPDHSCCTISGWGHTHEKANSYSPLMEGQVRIIPFSACSSPEVYGTEIRSGMICAGRDSCVDACQGDSGGPLACECEGVSFLYGIISWGDGCGRSGKPGVYTHVPKYVDWINGVIKGNRKNTTRTELPITTKPDKININVCIGRQCK